MNYISTPAVQLFTKCQMEKLLLFLVSVCFFTTVLSFEYSELEMMGVSCSPRDTCSSIQSRTFLKTNCECDNWCVSIGDCCVDASTRSNNPAHKRLGLICLPVFPDQGVYGIRECKSSWNESVEVRSKCENQDDLSNPLLSLPFTDTHTNVTYRNRYCAECNYENLNSLSHWNLIVTCNSLAELNELYGNITQEFIQEHITRVGDSWGVYQWNATLEDMAFHPCEISFRIPQDLKPHVRYCRPNIISTCATNYTRTVVRRYCEQYMAVIYIDGQGYRNAHCALCNHISLRNRVCWFSGFTTRRTGPSLNFNILIDFNERGGADVGSINSCSSGQIYDTKFKKCRTLICGIPGQIMRDGRCLYP